jgi:UbiD family decarboxylase
VRAPRSTAEFLKILKTEGELLEIDLPLSPQLVIPEIQRRVAGLGGPALLFRKVTGKRFAVATNLYGSQKRIDLALGGNPAEAVKRVTSFMENLPPTGTSIKKLIPALGRLYRTATSKTYRPPVLRHTLESLDDLPALTSWPLDGGPFVTLPLVYTQDPVTRKGNLGMYRVQIHDAKRAGMHIQIHRGGGNHYAKAEKQRHALPASVFIGGPPALTLAAVAPLPEDVPELVFASFLMNRKIKTCDNPDCPGQRLVSDADFCITGMIPPEQRLPEGPFGDHYGYYSLEHPYPFLEVSSIYHRKGAIYPATVVGRPPQEDHYIAMFLQELFAPLFPLVMKGVRDVFAYEESGVHSLAGALVQERYHKEAFTACMRILGEGQLSLTKVLLATEADLDLKDFKSLFMHILERCDFRTDLHIFSNISLDSLDYTGPEINRGSKAIFLGLGEKKFDLSSVLPTPSTLPDCIFANALFCPGVLVIKVPDYPTMPDVSKRIMGHPSLKTFRLVILHDDPQDAVSSASSFIWNVFTRFEPAGDINGQHSITRNHIAFEAPLIIDCRIKPGYPGVLEVDPETKEIVDDLWGKLGLP